MKLTSVLAELAAFAAALTGAGPGFAQPTSREARPVTEAVRVNVVNLEVFVTGPHGRPVLDLKPEDFELREDGAIVALTNFLAPAPAAAAPGAAARPRQAAPEAAEFASEANRRTLVVFVDDINLTPRSRKPVLARLRGFLAERTAEGYRVVVLSYNRSLQQYTPLTTDPDVVAAALDKLERAAFQGIMNKAQRDGILREMGRPLARENSATGDLDRQMLATEARNFALEQEQLNRDLLGVLIKVVDSLAGVPGRKTVLYVSDGVPLEPGADVQGEADSLPQTGGEARDTIGPMTLRARLRDVARRANASRITFYTINGGVSSGRDVSAEIAVGTTTDVDTVDAFSRDPSLSQLAVGTGGLKLPNADALPAMVADLEASYSLGYSPSHYGDGKYHRLSVKVKRAGVSVRCREGYLDKTPAQRLADVASAALFAGGYSNPLDARVKIGSPEKQGRNKVLLPLTVFVPAGRLVLLENGAMHEGQVSVTIAAAKAGGRRSEVAHSTFPIRVPSQDVAAFLQQDVSFEFSLLVESGGGTIAVTARDEVAQVSSVVVTEVAAAPPKS